CEFGFPLLVILRSFNVGFKSSNTCCDLVLVLRLHLAPCLRVLLIKLSLLLLSKLLQKEEACLHTRSGRVKRFLRQRNHSPNEGPILHILAYIGKARVVINAFWQDNTKATAGLQKGETAFDEQNFRLDASRFLGQFKERSNRLALRCSDTCNGFLV